MDEVIERISYDQLLTAYRAVQTFLLTAPIAEIRKHQRRASLAKQYGFDLPVIDEHNRSHWSPPEGLLSSDQVWELPVGSVVRWTGDRRESGLRVRVGALKRVASWHPAIGDGDYYWLVSRG